MTIMLRDDKPTFVGGYKLIDFDGEEIPLKVGDVLRFYDGGTGKRRGDWTVEALDYRMLYVRRGETWLPFYNGEPLQPALF